jgi:hypothetical protein
MTNQSNIVLIIFLILSYSCSDTIEKYSKQKKYEVIEYDDGLVRKGFYQKEVPQGVHSYYRDDSLFKVIQYINWDEEYIDYLIRNAKKFDIFNVDSSDHNGYPNAELFVTSKNKIDRKKSNFISYKIESDTSVSFDVNISRFKSDSSEKWLHLFIFKENDVRYISKYLFSFTLNLTTKEVKKIKLEEYKLYCMAAVVNEKISYVHSKPIILSDILNNLTQ